MKHSILTLTLLIATVALAQSGFTQPPGGFGGGGFGGPPGGFGGGGFGGGGDRGDRGSRGDRGGDRGGGDRGGGDRGGGDRGGGDRSGGGFGGFSSGGGGGFDPSSFLTRMDTNGNGMLDPEEAQGPARFMLDRMARTNPKIDITKPIPMSTLTESFQQMRSGFSGGGGPGGGSEEEIPLLEKNSLVPGFAKAKVEKAPVPGFGASAERFSVPVEERDLKEADDKMRLYDKNNDQHLDENELKEGRWSDSPMQYDKNKDGKLSRQELASRYARRRLASGAQTDASKKEDLNKRSRDNRDVVEDKKDKTNPMDKKSSYRIADATGKAPGPAGVPEWFISSDTDGDNQVSMAEKIKKWSQDEVDKFLTYDTNNDGFITTKECLAAVKKGVFMAGTSSSSTSATAGSGAKTDDAAKPVGSTAATPDGQMKEWAAKKLKSKDRDNNGFLSPDEYGDNAKFPIVDANKDGKIDVDEYANSRK